MLGALATARSAALRAARATWPRGWVAALTQCRLLPVPADVCRYIDATQLPPGTPPDCAAALCAARAGLASENALTSVVTSKIRDGEVLVVASSINVEFAGVADGARTHDNRNHNPNL